MRTSTVLPSCVVPPTSTSLQRWKLAILLKHIIVFFFTQTLARTGMTVTAAACCSSEAPWKWESTSPCRGAAGVKLPFFEDYAQLSRGLAPDTSHSPLIQRRGLSTRSHCNSLLQLLIKTVEDSGGERRPKGDESRGGVNLKCSHFSGRRTKSAAAATTDSWLAWKLMLPASIDSNDFHWAQHDYCVDTSAKLHGTMSEHDLHIDVWNWMYFQLCIYFLLWQPFWLETLFFFPCASIYGVVFKTNWPNDRLSF